nr:hypothetical protein [Frankia tisae]
MGDLQAVPAAFGVCFDEPGRDQRIEHGCGLTRGHRGEQVRPSHPPPAVLLALAQADHPHQQRPGGLLCSGIQPHQDQWTAFGQPCPHLDDQVGDHPLPAEEPPLAGGVEPGEARIGTAGRPGRIIDVPGRGRERGRRDGPSRGWSGRREPGGR